MKTDSKFNLVIMGVSCLDGMASSMRVRNLIEPLLKDNLINVNNLIHKKDYSDLSNCQNEGKINEIYFRIISFNLRNLFSLISYIFKGIRFINKSKSKTGKNILYNYQYPEIKNILFLVYAKIKGYYIIFDIVEDLTYFNPDNKFEKFRIWSSNLFVKFSPKLANAIITISSDLYKKMNLICNNKIPVYHIPISVNLSYFPDKKKQKFDHDIKIFYGGSFGEKDGIEFLFKAVERIISKFDNVKLILTGRANKTDGLKLKILLDEFKYKDKIIFYGFLDTTDYYELLNSCDIFCLTRINSKFANAGFPFKLGEFLATRKAVICTMVGDVTQYLSNDINSILIPPESVEKLVESISFLIENPDKIISLGMEGRKVSEKYFDSELLSKNLLTIFNMIR